MEIRTICTNGFAMRYFRFGNEQGQPLVIIPGVALKSVMEAASAVKAQYRAFAGDYDIYVFDRREDMPQDFSVRDMAADTVRALELLHPGAADLYGVSQGGMIAMLAATARPESVRKLAVCSTSPYIPRQAAEVFSCWTRLAAEKQTAELMLSFAENIYSESFRSKFGDIFPEFAKTVTDTDLKRFIAMSGSFGELDIRDSIRKISCPVLVLAGDSDRLFAPCCAEKTAALTGGELHIYSGAAHAVYDEEPDVLVRLKEFLDRN
ncbi:MAG: alpha/beta hydrolase [Ruminococcus sp.]|nr:alpha/beta hydrolase [Ruminococcus sp.]